MDERPSLSTSHLFLRSFTLADAPAVQGLVSARAVADTTRLPHPYEDGMAAQWINTHYHNYVQGSAIDWAIIRQDDGVLTGAVGLRLHQDDNKAELGYWLGTPFWGQGYGTEAARAAVQYGFAVRHLQRIYAYYLVRNPVSGRVLQKVGMRYEGCLRQHAQRWGIYEDVIVCGMVQEDWRSLRR